MASLEDLDECRQKALRCIDLGSIILSCGVLQCDSLQERVKLTRLDYIWSRGQLRQQDGGTVTNLSSIDAVLQSDIDDALDQDFLCALRVDRGQIERHKNDDRQPKHKDVGHLPVLRIPS